MRELSGALLVPVPGFAVSGPSIRLDHGELVAAAVPVTFADDFGLLTVVTGEEFKTGQDLAVDGCDPEIDPDCGQVATVDLADLPDPAEVLAARDPRRIAAKMAEELGLDLQTRKAALVASVRGDT
jgi:hypothetical protein